MDDPNLRERLVSAGSERAAELSLGRSRAAMRQVLDLWIEGRGRFGGSAPGVTGAFAPGDMAVGGRDVDPSVAPPAVALTPAASLAARSLAARSLAAT